MLPTSVLSSVAEERLPGVGQLSVQRRDLGTSSMAPGFGSAGAVELWTAEREHALRRPAAVRAGSQASCVCVWAPEPRWGRACSARFGEKPRTQRGAAGFLWEPFLEGQRRVFWNSWGPEPRLCVATSIIPALPASPEMSLSPPMASALQTLASLVREGTKIGAAGSLLRPRLGLLLSSQQHKPAWILKQANHTSTQRKPPAEKAVPRMWDFRVSLGDTCRERAAGDSGEAWGSPTRPGADQGRVGCVARGAGWQLRP